MSIINNYSQINLEIHILRKMEDVNMYTFWKKKINKHDINRRIYGSEVQIILLDEFY